MDSEQQKREIETIKERSVSLKLSDSDCEDILKLCGKHNITIAELLEGFIGDLIGGTHTNGSDERLYAERYFERCGYGMFPEPTLLNWLLTMGYDVYDDFLEVIDDIETGYADLEDYKKDPSVFDDEEIEFLKEDIGDWEHQIEEIKANFLEHNEKADWEKEVEKVNEWWKEKERFIYSYDENKTGNIEISEELESPAV